MKSETYRTLAISLAAGLALASLPASGVVTGKASDIASGSASGVSAATDSLVYKPAAQIDSALAGRSIFDLLSDRSFGEGEVSVHQSQAIAEAMRSHILSNPARTLSGYRVRIFFDNSQSARGDSEEILKEFGRIWPGIPAYRTYQNPFFEVKTGNFRTKSEAMIFLNKVKTEYPAAIIIKENISYPPADKNHLYDVDTVSVASDVPEDAGIEEESFKK